MGKIWNFFQVGLHCRPVFLAVTLLYLCGCNYRHEKGVVEEPLTGEPWFFWIQRTIVEPKCLSCHGGPGGAMGLDLSSYDLWMASGAVVPYKPEQSKFFTAIKSGAMPKGNGRLSDREIQRVYDWIEKGAFQGAPTPNPTPEPVPPPKPTFSWINQNIFQTKCVGCHQPPKPKGDVDFSSYKKLMNSEGIIKKPVESGNPNESEIIDQLHEKKMPPGPNKLTQIEEQVIYDWIKSGAEEN